MSKNIEKKAEASQSPLECFVIMPIADPDGYDKGHFTKVYEDIFKPACEVSGYKPVRADEVKQTNLIHLDILQKLIESPMAICDLSSRNPNVLFELGLRQAFDKPTVLVQEIGTPKIFDIAPLRYTEYRKELRYREVLEDQQFIAEAINATREATSKGEGVNSIVSILSLSKPATLKEVSEGDSSGLLQLVRAEMSEMRSDFRRAMHTFENNRMANTPDFMSPGGMSNITRRIRDAKEMIREVEILIDQGAPMEYIIEKTSSIQKRLSRFMENDTPDRYRDEARHLFMMCEELERHALARGK